MPLPLTPSRWNFPDPNNLPEDDLVAIGADLAPETIIEGYTRGFFPMHASPKALGWWSPDPRGIIPLDTFRPSRSLRKSMRRFEIRFDTNFGAVIRGCADPTRPHGWIRNEIIEAYEELHRLGWAHSVEVIAVEEEKEILAGGLYGIAIGSFFAAESKFHQRTDASKVAVAALVEHLRERGGKLLDVQWATPHLKRLGAIEISRTEYLEHLADVIDANVSLFG